MECVCPLLMEAWPLPASGLHGETSPGEGGSDQFGSPFLRRGEPGQRAETPRPRLQRPSLPRAAADLRRTFRAGAQQLGSRTPAGPAGVSHAADAAEAEPHHAHPEAPGSGPYGDPAGERVQVFKLKLGASGGFQG